MPTTAIEQDLQTAQQICADIQNGDYRSLNEWFGAHYQNMLNFLINKQRENPEDQLHAFYLEMQTGNAFCQYQGRNNCSLKSYIMGRLRLRTLPQRSSEKKILLSLDEMMENNMIPAGPENCCNPYDEKTQLPEKIQEILFSAFDQLSADSKTREDVQLIRWKMDNLPSQEMAAKMLIYKNSPLTDQNIRREAARIRKRLARNGGSIIKFRKKITKILRENGFSETDLY